MTNVLPPQAKKQIIREYWVRVFCAWVILWSFCLLLGAFLFWPTLVLLDGKVTAYESSVAAAEERDAEFITLGQQLVAATQQAKDITAIQNYTTMTGVVTDLTNVTDQYAVDVTGIAIQKSDGVLKSISLEGVASDRRALANLRGGLLELPFVNEVNVPLSASNQNIEFTLQVSVIEESV